MNKVKSENQKKLLRILNEIFQLDQSDLDFGIYRIMNTKSQEINKFLDKELISSVASAFSLIDNNSLQKELDELIKTLTNAGINADDSPKVQELKDALSSSSTSTNLENDVFSHLANFFKRYYKDGDFVTLRRYKKDTYAIPYEGEEVKLHWANSDQYYIKSGEYFRDYTFRIDDKIIHFKLSNAQTESNNNKATSDKERRFVYIGSEVLTSHNELNINFEYKSVGKGFKQDKLNEESIQKVLEDITNLEFINALNTLAATEKNKKRTIFEKHLKSYTSRNSFDYFIHKDLGGFLSRELDFYIKNEMLFLDDIMDSSIKYEEVMGKVKIFKEVSQKIISFLTQLEELQKKLWEKKKFVIETNYCITLDKINEEYYEDIFACKEQLAEWKELFNVDIQSVDDLKEEKYLVLDTKNFDMKFKYKLLSEFDNLDDEIDGVLINSENFGALNLLQDRYKEKVQSIYIDPPYNTNASEIIYMNGYKHSSWMSLLENRLSISKSFLRKDGVIEVAIDDEEQRFIHIILDSIYGQENFVSNIPIMNNPRGRSDAKHIAPSHEYLIFYANNIDLLKTNELIQSEKELKDKYPKKDEISSYRELPLKRSGSNSKRTERPNLFYPIYFSKLTNKLSLEKLNDEDIEILPIDLSGIERCWRWGKDKVQESLETEFVIKNNDNIYSIAAKDRVKNTIKPKSFWFGAKHDSSSHGTMLLKHLFKSTQFSYPKSINSVIDTLAITGMENSIILDFFAGSGTTGHAIINLNREDNGKRKYLLVEMGEYFDSVTKPRIQKVIYSDSWKDGKPQTKNGISQIFKYFKLESYEDTLNNLEFKKTKEQEDTLALYQDAKEDYLLNYSLDIESQASLLDIDSFKTPFCYKLKIATSSVGETKDTNIDLVETFNYLLGLVLESIRQEEDFLIVQGTNLKKQKILIIWRDDKTNEELDSFVKSIDFEKFDEVYINGDTNLENVKLIEDEFKKLMFNE
ncbi:MAG: site-specific DNA-methyltransferase [Campylobacterota bacterium]|nr:site-specific DNA-methyltransferase [Campylobacterota bacterium]